MAAVVPPHGGSGVPFHGVVRSETNQRENNEDSFHIYEVLPVPGECPLKVLAIADGMGGYAFGEQVSRETLRRISLSLFEQLTADPAINRLDRGDSVSIDQLAVALWQALQQTNAHILRMVHANKWGKAGSTVVVVVVDKDVAVVANLGDSPVFHYQASTRLLRKVTDDHTVAGALLRAGMIAPEMARYHEGRARLEFFLGAERLPQEAPVHYIDLASGDILLLCTDGVCGLLLESEIAEIVADPSLTLEQIAASLLEASRAAGETDNQTLILWQCVESQGAASTPTSVHQDTFDAPTVIAKPRQSAKSEEVGGA